AGDRDRAHVVQPCVARSSQVDYVPCACDVRELGGLGRCLQVVNGGEVEEVRALEPLLVCCGQSQHRLTDVAGDRLQALTALDPGDQLVEATPPPWADPPVSR